MYYTRYINLDKMSETSRETLLLTKNKYEKSTTERTAK